MMRSARQVSIGALLALLCSVGMARAQGGPFSAQIENFWRLISSGGRNFTAVGIGGSAAGFPLHVIANTPTFGVATVVRFENDDQSATSAMGFDVLTGTSTVAYFRVLVKGENNATPQIFLGANSTHFDADLALGATNLPVWLVKAGSVQGAPLGNLLTATDNQFDIGASGANRPRSIFAGTSVVAPVENATTKFQINGVDGATHAACSTSVTAITVTGGIITSITCT